MNHRITWVAAGVTFGLVDVATTGFAISNGLASEGNPLIATALATTSSIFPTLIALKAIAFGVFYLLYLKAPEEYRHGVPIGLLMIGVVVAIHNFRVFV